MSITVSFDYHCFCMKCLTFVFGKQNYMHHEQIFDLIELHNDRKQNAAYCSMLIFHTYIYIFATS